MKEFTHKEICEAMNLYLQCAKCGSKVKNACDYCLYGFNHWSNCYEEAKQILINKSTIRNHEKSERKSAIELDKFLKNLDW